MVNLKNLKRGKDLFNVATTLLDQAVLPPQEKADKSIEYQERTGSTPSSESRRWVTKFMLIYISLFSVVAVLLYRFDPEWGEFAFKQLKEYCSNWVIVTIIVFFYGGYYVRQGLKDKQKVKVDQQRKDHELEIMERENELEVKKSKDILKLRKKRKRFLNRKER